MTRMLMRMVRAKHQAAWVRLCYCQPFGYRPGRFDVQVDWLHHGGSTHIHGDANRPAWLLLWRIYRMSEVQRGKRFHVGYPEYADDWLSRMPNGGGR